MRKFSDGTSAGNLDIGYQQGRIAGILKIIFNLDDFTLLYKTKIIFSILEFNVSAVILALSIRGEKKKISRTYIICTG